jgi:hypothetical protein
MRTDPTTAPAAEKRGFFARLMGGIRYRFRKLFGKSDDPKIYPFF